MSHDKICKKIYVYIIYLYMNKYELDSCQKLINILIKNLSLKLPFSILY